MFKKILIANRGEIAVRLIRACKEMGIISVAVYTDADKTSLHARLADEAYYIGESDPSKSYLHVGKIINIALEAKADAIHPGYGFLSENAEFITEIESKNIVFIGPSPHSVLLMGNKTAARKLMKKHGVPIVPGTTTPIKDANELKKTANEIGFPVLLKAAAGGGGKGMKLVQSESELISSFESATREAKKSFGNDAVYIEKYIASPKHIEVQIIADKHGNYLHLFERECSVQRRHQKIIEEAPSTFIDENTRQKITEAAINAAKACDYYNAGTIEFLMDKNKNFYFLEMNTRLQVEHPITELITGIDIVHNQIRIANGEPLAFTQDEIKIQGHAIECRVYAENPDENFLPEIGTIDYHRLPAGPGVRVDEGVALASNVTPNYDPLLTKISVSAKTRKKAIDKMKVALASYRLSGVQTNIQAMLWVLQNQKFIDGSYSITLLQDEFIPLLPDKWKAHISDNIADVASLFSTLLREKEKKSLSCKVANNTESNWNRQQ